MRIVVRVRRARTRIGRFVGLSVGAHVFAVAGLLVAPFLRPKPPLIPHDATFVELAGPVTASAPAAVAARPPAPPAPPKAAEPEGAHAVEKIPEPSKKKDDKKKEEKKKEEPPAPARPSAPGPTGPPGPAPPGAPAGAPGPAGPAGITSLGSADPGLAWYNAAVAGALENAWMKPVIEGVAGTQSVIVAFDIGRDGNVFNLQIDTPSGIASLDRSALRAVQDASPFPPPPPAARGTSVRQRIRFDLRPGTP